MDDVEPAESAWEQRTGEAKAKVGKAEDELRQASGRRGWISFFVFRGHGFLFWSFLKGLEGVGIFPFFFVFRGLGRGWFFFWRLWGG